MTTTKAISFCIVIVISNLFMVCFGEEVWSVKKLATVLSKSVPGREGNMALLLLDGQKNSELLRTIYLIAEKDLAKLALCEEKLEEPLLKLAEHDPRFRVRYRALYLLAVRNPAVAFPLVRASRRSNEPIERLAGWGLSREFFADATLSDRELQDEALRLYADEKDEEIRKEMRLYFGDIKASFAVPALIETIRDEDCHDVYALTALGEIGDARAVPAIIECSMRKFHPTFCALALGRIGTPEAVAYLIDHIDEDHAIEALGFCGDPRALKAISLYLVRNRANEREYDARRIGAARIAVIQLASPNPVTDLLEVADDSTEPDYARFRAEMALGDHSADGNADQVLAIYKNTEEWSVKLTCIRLLSESPEEEVTATMIRHLLDMPSPHRIRDTVVIQSELHVVLNKRLNTRFLQVEDLKEYLRAHFKK